MRRTEERVGERKGLPGRLPLSLEAPPLSPHRPTPPSPSYAPDTPGGTHLLTTRSAVPQAAPTGFNGASVTGRQKQKQQTPPPSWNIRQRRRVTYAPNHACDAITAGRPPLWPAPTQGRDACRPTKRDDYRLVHDFTSEFTCECFSFLLFLLRAAFAP